MVSYEDKHCASVGPVLPVAPAFVKVKEVNTYGEMDVSTIVIVGDVATIVPVGLPLLTLKVKV